MARIINVDFKAKKLQYTFDDGRDEKLDALNQISKNFLVTIQAIEAMFPEDVVFKNYVTRGLRGIVEGAKERL